MILLSTHALLGLEGAWLDDFARGSRGEYPLAVKVGGGALFGTAGLILEQVRSFMKGRYLVAQIASTMKLCYVFLFVQESLITSLNCESVCALVPNVCLHGVYCMLWPLLCVSCCRRCECSTAATAGAASTTARFSRASWGWWGVCGRGSTKSAAKTWESRSGPAKKTTRGTKCGKSFR